MPGMMDTVLNLGLNDQTCKALFVRLKTHALPMIPIDGSCRCIRMWCLGLKPRDKARQILLKQIIEEKKRSRGFHSDAEFTADDLKEIVDRYKAEVKSEILGRIFRTILLRNSGEP